VAYIETRTRKEGKPSYVVRYRKPDRSMGSKTFRRKTDAETFLHSVETSQDNGSYIDPAGGKLTFGPWAQKWQRSRVNGAPSTRAAEDSYLKSRILPRWGEVPLSAVTAMDVREWVADLTEDGPAPATVHKVVQIFSKVLGIAVEDRRLAMNPAANVRLPRISREEGSRAPSGAGRTTGGGDG